MQIKRTVTACLAILALAAVSIPAQQQKKQEERSAYGGTVVRAVAVIRPTKGNSATGTVTFIQAENGTRIVAEVRNLSPGRHGFHIHEFGDCTAPDATSAGGHFNPTDLPHAGPEAPSHHVGDLGNIEVRPDGTARYDRVIPGVQLDGEHGIIGRAVVIHQGADDLTSQPSGDSGPRVACGVIGIAETGR